METVADVSQDVNDMMPAWRLVDALLGGTETMRKASGAYLPKWPDEAGDSYMARLESSTLFPGFSRTVTTLSGKPFSKPLTYGDDVPAQIKELCEANCDLQGRDLHTFAADVLTLCVSHGLALIYTDFPSGPPAPTQAEEKAQGRRPYLVLIKPTQVLGWRVAVQGGATVLTMLRYMEWINVDDGQFSTKCVQQVRVVEPGRWRTFRRVVLASGVVGDDWALFEEGTTTLAYVPVAIAYGQRTGFMCAKPPLIELAYMNVEHWQSASDQRVLMHVARVPILTAIGIDDPEFALTIGASNVVKMPADCDLKYVEHTGQAIGAGVTDLAALEERMRQAGAELLIPRPSQTTAFQVKAENDLGASVLQMIALGTEDAIDLALQYWAEYIGQGQGGHVTLFNDYASMNLSEASSADLLKANLQGVVSNETVFEELQRRGVLSTDLDWTDEQDRIDSEGPSLGTLGTIDPITGLPVAPRPTDPNLKPPTPPAPGGTVPVPPAPRPGA